jgi:pilus assembly protein Flp/PilA
MTKLFTKVQSAMLARQNDEEGATMVEYGLLVAFIALVALAGVKLLGTDLNKLFTDISF